MNWYLFQRVILFLPPKMLSWLTHKNNIPCNHWLQKDTKEICAIHLLTLLQTSRIALICSPLHPTQGIESNEKHIIYVFTQSTITQMKELQLCKAIPASRVQEYKKVLSEQVCAAIKSVLRQWLWSPIQDPWWTWSKSDYKFIPLIIISYLLVLQDRSMSLLS